jgi:hypothetical protein
VAGGIDWFRWHHGTVTDQKFPLVAKRAGASVAEVIAVWACLLESASMNAMERGCLDGAPDFESMDCALGLSEGRAQAVFQAMQSRDLLDEHLQVTAWPKRQPKREREDDSSTARVQAFRERQRQETPRNATERAETPRGEESREEEIPREPTALVASADAERAARGYTVPPCPTQDIVNAYAEVLPMLPQVAVLNDSRRRAIAARWREVTGTDRMNVEQGREWFRWFFDRVRGSPFLTGNGAPDRNGRVWRADLDWLMAPTHFARVIEGRYHGGKQA